MDSAVLKPTPFPSFLLVNEAVTNAPQECGAADLKVEFTAFVAHLSLRMSLKRKLSMKNCPAATQMKQESLESSSDASPAPFMQTSSPKALDAVFRKMDAFMEFVNERLDRMESMLCEVREELRAARENEPVSQKRK